MCRTRFSSPPGETFPAARWSTTWYPQFAPAPTDNVTPQDLGPLIGGLFSKWVENGTTPIGARFEGGLRLGSKRRNAKS